MLAPPDPCGAESAPMVTASSNRPGRPFRVVLSSTALRSFTSVWKAAALALAELGIAAVFLIGVTRPVLGSWAPWFVLGAAVCTAFARAIDIESWSLLLPGGPAGRAELAFGPRAASAAAATVLIERLLLASLASVIVGQYVAGFVDAEVVGWRLGGRMTVEEVATPIACVLLGAVWIRARLGVARPRATFARGIGVAVAVLTACAIWGVVTSLHRPGVGLALLPPLPRVDAAGWSWTAAARDALIGMALVLPVIGAGDSLSRGAHEFPPPRLRALRRTAALVVLFAIAITAGLAFLFLGLVPDEALRVWMDAPLAGLAQYLSGPAWAQHVMAILLIVAVALLLVPATDAALSDGEQTLRRLATAHALPEGLAAPHPRFGTLAHAIDVAAAGSAAMLWASGGRVMWLAHAYALAVGATLLVRIAALVRLRRTRRDSRPFLAPGNLHLGAREVPLGLAVAGLVVLAAVTALLSAGDVPALATTGLLVGLALLFTSRQRSAERIVADDLDAFELLPSADLALGQVDARPGNLLVTVRHTHLLAHVGAALQAAGDRDVVVMTVRLLGVDIDGDAFADTEPTPSERRLFSQVVLIAERYGRPVRLLIVPARNVFDAIATTVLRLRSSEVYVGESSTLPADDQARLLGEAWENADKSEAFDVRLVIYHHSGRTDAYHLGAHPPSLTASDLDLLHRLWLDAVKSVGPHVHHHDVVRAALTQMQQQLSGPQREDALAAIRDLARPADELAAAVRDRDFSRLRDMVRNRHASDLAAMLTTLSTEDQVVIFRVLPRKDAAAVFEYLSREAQETLLKAMAQEDVAALLNNMAPDDRTMFLEELPAAATRRLLALLTPAERSVALTLLGYPEGSVGRLMTPHYVAIREHWTVREVLDYIRAHGQDSETLNTVYVVDEIGTLVDDIRIRELLLTALDAPASTLLDRRFAALKATDDEQTAVAVFRQYDRTALPVTDTAGMLIGIVTIDDVLDVAEAAATKDIQRIGGSEALDEPYMQIAFGRMVRKRAGWLTALFLGEMLTATAMGAFEAEISKAVVLALFVPLIISSGGNSGSQASTLVIRALALGEVGLHDWWRVMRREVMAGLALGTILGSIGFARITVTSRFTTMYGSHPHLVALTVGIALVGIVLWGTVVGSVLPFILRRLGFDPATSSAPFVATLVDVTGLVIYFSVALIILRGVML
jgi:magnesium transporter